MTPESENEHPQISGSNMKVGEMLVAARDEAGMTSAQIAGRLNLDQSTVDALESGNDSVLPPAIFVRGYIRAYAKIVGISGDAAVAVYDGGTDVKKTPDLKLNADSAQPGDDRAFPFGWLIGFVLLLFVLGATWYYAASGSEPVNTSELVPVIEPETVAVQDSSAGLALDSAPVKPVQNETLIAAETLTQSAETNEPSAPATASDSQGQPSVTGVRSAPSLTSALIFGEDATSAAAEPQPADEEADSSQAPAEETPASESNTPPADIVSLTVTVAEEAWVSIRSAEDKGLVRELMRPGTTRNVSGKGPLAVYLGNAPSVSIVVDGVQFEHSAFHRSNNTARFKVGGAN